MIQWYVSWIRDFSKVIQEMTRSKRNPRVQDHWGSNRRCAHPDSGRKQKGFFPVRWTALKKWWHGFVLKWKIYSRNSKNGCFMLFQPNENWSLKTGISYLATIPYKGCMTIQLIVKWKNPTTKPIVWSWVFTPNGETRSFHHPLSTPTPMDVTTGIQKLIWSHGCRLYITNIQKCNVFPPVSPSHCLTLVSAGNCNSTQNRTLTGLRLPVFRGPALLMDAFQTLEPWHRAGRWHRHVDIQHGWSILRGLKLRRFFCPIWMVFKHVMLTHLPRAVVA